MKKKQTPYLNLVCAVAAIISLTTSAQAAELIASDRAAVDSFSVSVSQSGTMALIGAYGDDDNGDSSGSAYVYRDSETARGAVTEAVKLTASDGAANDRFGRSVSQFGTMALVGQHLYSFGSAYVYRDLDIATETVTENVKLTASDASRGNWFGISVGLSGTVALVGAYGDDDNGFNSGSVYVFRDLDMVTGTVTEDLKLTASDGVINHLFGWSVSQSGTMALVGAYGDGDNGSYSGSAYVYRNLDTATGIVTENVKLAASDGDAGDRFGYSVSQSGAMALVGAYGDNGVSMGDVGSAYVFRDLDMATGTVTENVKLTASDGASLDYFGDSVSLSETAALVGAPGVNQDGLDFGSAYIFIDLDLATGTITENVKLTASDSVAGDKFGRSVSIDGDLFIVGSQQGEGDVASAGKAYLGRVSSMTNLDVGNTSRMIDGISFVSHDDWIIGQTTSGNLVTLSAGDSAEVTASGKGVYIGQNTGAESNTLILQGSLTTNSVYIGQDGSGILNIGHEGSAFASHDITVKSGTGSGTVNIEVSGDAMLHAGADGTGDFVNNGIVNLFAYTNLAAGIYTPIEAGSISGARTGVGTYNAFGGTFNAVNGEFAVGEFQVVGAGGITGQDLSGNRLSFYGGNLTVAFGITSGMSDFNAMNLSVSSIGDETVIDAYKFTTDLTGNDGLLAFFVGEGLELADLSIWHLADGDTNWELLLSEYLNYSDGWIRFVVSDFGSYAVTEPSIPEIDIHYEVQELTSGQSIDLGEVALGATQVYTFTISNNGSAPLNNLDLTKDDGSTAADYVFGALSTTTLAAGESTDFEVTFTPSVIGERSVTLSVVSDDADENPFALTLAGTGLLPDLVSAYNPGDFSVSTTGDHPQVSVPLGGSLPSSLYFDIELVDISGVNSEYGSYISMGFLNSGVFLGEFQIAADSDVGGSNGIFGDLIGRNTSTSASLDSGGIPEGTRVWMVLTTNGDTVSAQVINQADESVIYSGSYSIPGVQAADELMLRTYDNEGTIMPTLITGGAEDYWEIRSTRSGVDMTVNFYGVSVSAPVNSDSDPGSDTWETANGFDPNVDGDVATLDSDGDGDLDIFEIFQGTDRNGSSESYGFQEVGVTSGEQELTTQFRRSTTQSAVAAVSQWSCDLVNWYDSGESADGITVSTTETVVSSGSGYEIIEAKTEVTSGSSDCIFYRLELLPIE
ncbi:MAG: choice-of-anchor D domain-containing protein [Opitutaceae bacterium]